MAARLAHLALIHLQIDVEMGEHMVAQVARLIAQRLELRQAGCGCGATGDEIGAHVAERLLQLRVVERATRIVLEALRRGEGGHASLPS
jgi:hypothetical protein